MSGLWSLAGGCGGGDRPGRGDVVVVVLVPAIVVVVVVRRS